MKTETEVGNKSLLNDGWRDPSPHSEHFVEVNGVRLNYLDWGGTGEALVLIPGSTNNPHAFDGIAPQLIDRFRTVSYARRGDGRSEDKGPYDVETMVEDLRQFLDRIGISKPHLAGWSLGGHELTRFAGRYPERVGKLIYLDAAYDWSDPVFADAWTRRPEVCQPTPSSADLESMEAYKKWLMARSYRAGVPWSAGFEAFARGYLAEDPNGQIRFLEPDATGWDKRNADRSPYRRDYSAVRAPALAIYVPDFLPNIVGTPAQQEALRRWNKDQFLPWQKQQRLRFEKAMPGAQIRILEGANHMIFPFTHRSELVRIMRDFLLGEGTRP